MKLPKKIKQAKQIVLRKNVLAIALPIIAVVACGGSLLIHHVATANAHRQGVNGASSLDSKVTDKHSAISGVASQSQAKSQSNTQAAGSNSTSTPPKYATSADPRSTAYSLTPPKQNQADFNTVITHNGQVAAGTLIGYSAEKYGLHTYYGGDLAFSVSSVVVSLHSGNTSAPFSVSIPDGAVSRAPSMPANDQSSIGFPAYSAAPNSGTSWSMFIQLTGAPQPSVTPYTIHLETFRSNSGDDEWVYDGFLSVYVTN